MKRIAVFPGSFDPITKGHESIVKRAIPLFDQIVIAIGVNINKTYFFPLEKRLGWIEKVFEQEDRVIIDQYQGLTVDYCKKINGGYILRGLRNSSDFEFEKSIAQMNHAMVPDLETIIMYTEPKYAAISSSIIRDIIRNGGDVRQFLPDAVDLQ